MKWLIPVSTVLWIVVIVWALVKAPVLGFVLLASIIIAAILFSSGGGDGTRGRRHF